ncbi:acyl-CoA thioesterase [Azospirillum argentinense]
MTDPTRPDPYRFWIAEHVRFADLDALGHVNNNAIGVYFEQSRVSLVHECGGFRSEAPWTVVLARSVIDYKAELLFPADIRVGARVAKVGNTSVILGAAIFDGDRCIAVQEAVCVIVGKDSHRPIPVPADLRDALARYA